MNRDEWDKILTCFQARVRGYLVRREVRRAREDFEDIVKEIDGRLTHLEWRVASCIPTPHFTDTDDPLTPAYRAASRPPDPELNPCASPQRQPSPDEEGHHILLEKIEAERDGSQSKGLTFPHEDCFPCSGVREERRRSRQTTDGGVMENTEDSTTVWSSLEQDADSYKGTQQSGSLQGVPHTPEALRLHRNTLTMELLWLQQAIDSRKKYLSLKNRLSIS
ncbi:IQ domain-containing protein C isoform X1 [Xyrichtys novacula]|uniref:IQ domain-containing protein C isoform X1 n=1 Tax=Xyrichtys novacula TaxID=13765 RepID=A0AAV1GIL4_XYRNO|nr:IQ domain-containing protein C isoform X1 [Xyrichtys novacula]